jgi:zinc transport system ATP-binding protein
VRKLSKLIDIKNLTVKYGDYTAIEKVDFSIEENKFVTIIGPNGGGKTTLIKAILGFIEPFKGKIVKSPNLKIGYVPQKNSFEQEFPISVSQVILSGDLKSKIRLLHRFKSKSWKRLDDTLKRLDISDLKDQQINELSGGQLQKVLLGRAIISNPNLLILDEPFSNIDTNSTNKYFHLLKELSHDMSILIISHDIGIITSFTDDVVCMNKTAHYHHGSHLTNEVLQDTYSCPVELIGHGIPHRVFPHHSAGDLDD